MKRLLFLSIGVVLTVIRVHAQNVDLNLGTPPNNEIWYTSTDGEIVQFNADKLDVTVLSNTYNNGKGIIRFSADVTSIEGDSFVPFSDELDIVAKCSNLRSIAIPNSVTEIGDYAFNRCAHLKGIDIPNSVVAIGDNAFNGCSSLTSLTIPGSVQYVGSGAFGWCSNLKCVDIPDGVTKIADATFKYCSSLTNVTIPDSVSYIGYEAFCGCSSLTGVSIPDCVQNIDGRAFCDCTNLIAVDIPNGVRRIEYYVFKGCVSLTSVNIPDSVTEIDYYAFYGCYNLTSVVIPNKINKIGMLAFGECKNLMDVVMPKNRIFEIENNAFEGCDNIAEWINSEIAYITSIHEREQEDFYGWVTRQLKYPQSAIKSGIQGTVEVQFTVGSDGKLGGIRVLKSPAQVLSDAVVEVLQKSPNWASRRHNESFVMSFPFNLKK